MHSFESSDLGRSNPQPELREESVAQQAESPFASLGLLPAIVRATVSEKYSEPTPVQRDVIPAVVAGRDVLASAQTGTGKTAAFVLPILHQLAMSERTGGGIRVLILTPTRELAAQIAERVAAYGRYLSFRHTVIYGGVSQYRQETALRQRPDLLVATPGRLLDLMNQGLVKLDQVAHFVLDEADRMLDMGFIHDVRRVIGALPKKRQTLLFSATVPRPIEVLSQSLLIDPVRVSVAPKVTSAETVEQSVVYVSKEQKGALLEQLLNGPEVERAIVFTRTKHGADKLSRRLEKAGIIAPAIHGNKSQGARERALEGFRNGRTRVLLATDLAARGIDIDGVSHVFNFDLPNVPESYVHRIGRTGRAGASGRAIAFCDRDERGLLADIERLLKHRLHVLDVALPSAAASAAPAGGPRPPLDVVNASREPRVSEGDRGERPQRPELRRPQGPRDGQRQYASRPQEGQRPQHGGRSQDAHRPQHGGQRPQHGSRPQNGGRPAFGARPHDGRPHDGQRPQFGARPQEGARPVHPADASRPREATKAPERHGGLPPLRRDEPTRTPGS